MTIPDIIWEWRQIDALERERDGKDPNQPEVYTDPGYDEELRSLGIDMEELERLRATNRG